MKKIALIPARSGSKGLKDKNIMDLCGKPLLAYSVLAALESRLFERVIVSTDSQTYGRIAEGYGAEVMYRGEELSDDSATTYMVVADVLGRCGVPYDYFVLLQPTSPMRGAAHIREAVSMFEDRMDRFDFLVSVKESDHAQALTRPLGEDGSLKYFDADFSNYRRQAYKDYCPNGAIFIGKSGAYLEQKHFFGARSMAYIMTKADSADIDDELDYELACICMARRMRGEG